jgi:hypothetical protein
MNTTMLIVYHNSHFSKRFRTHITDFEAKFHDDLLELVVSVVLDVVEWLVAS